MATLYVRNVPENVCERIRTLACSNRRSLNEQVLGMLEHALEIESQQQQQERLLESIWRRRFTPPADAQDSVELLREDRGRALPISPALAIAD